MHTKERKTERKKCYRSLPTVLCIWDSEVLKFLTEEKLKDYTRLKTTQVKLIPDSFKRILNHRAIFKTWTEPYLGISEAGVGVGEMTERMLELAFSPLLFMVRWKPASSEWWRENGRGEEREEERHVWQTSPWRFLRSAGVERGRCDSGFRSTQRVALLWRLRR